MSLQSLSLRYELLSHDKEIKKEEREEKKEDIKMGRGLGKIQEKILSALKELTRRNRRNWFSLLVVTIFLYTPWQIDPEHERNRNRLGAFKVDWSMEKKHHRRVWESCRALASRGLVEIRISKENVWGGCTRYMEIKIKEKDEGN